MLSLNVIYGDGDVKELCCICDWYNQFENGQESPEDKKSSRSATWRHEKNVTKV